LVSPTISESALGEWGREAIIAPQVSGRIRRELPPREVKGMRI
jgi:hypothetical protein